MKNGRGRVVLVAGGAGFIGSHLCDALIAEGDRVLCIDNFQTGTAAEPAPPRARAAVRADRSRRHRPAADRACRRRGCRSMRSSTSPAPPRRRTTRPIPSIRCSPTCSARATFSRSPRSSGARFLLASTSEVYGDPDVHPQKESYLRQRQPDRSARLLRRGQARRRGADVRLPPRRPRRGARRAHLQHLRPAHAAPTTAASYRT